MKSVKNRNTFYKIPKGIYMYIFCIYTIISELQNALKHARAWFLAHSKAYMFGLKWGYLILG